MADGHPNRYQMTEEDGHRMSRLSEEVRSRLLEMALITARTVGKQLGPDASPKFVPHARTDDAEKKKGDWIEIIDVDGEEACYGVIDGVPFAESPCGAGG